MSADAARKHLDAARKLRMLGDVGMCEEQAQAAHFHASAAGEGELAYHARACVGRLRFWRAEYDLAYQHYREALSEAEGWGLRRWLSPAHHDCFISATEAGFRPECTNGHKDHALDYWHLPGARTWAFVYDLYMSMVRRAPVNERAAERADLLRHTAISASWYTVQATPGGDWYQEYLAKFERVSVYAAMVHACGVLAGEGALPPAHLRRALNLFDMAADALGSDEGYALNLIDAAHGARAAGLLSTARGLLSRALLVAAGRDEDRVVAEADRLRREWNIPAEGEP